MAANRGGHRFQKGNKHAVGRADGRGKRLMTQQLISILNEEFREWNKKTERFRPDPTGITKLRKLLDNLVFNATVLKDGSAINTIFDRVEGKAMQGLEISGPGGESIEIETIRHVIVDPKHGQEKEYIDTTAHGRMNGANGSTNGANGAADSDG